jgi:glycosyltransferase involved in cell wall biosynthesis
VGELVVIPGRDPLVHAGGTESYCVAHGHAARLAGYEPRVFPLGPDAGTIRTEFGDVHRVATPVRLVRSIVSTLHRPWLVRAVAAFLRDRPGPHVVHAYGAWADSAVAIARVLGREGVEVVPIATFFTTAEHENVVKLRSEIVRTSALRALYQAVEVAWVRGVTTRSEHRAVRACRLVAVNYDSVRVLLDEAYGPGLELRRLPYTPATAFAGDAADAADALPPGDAPLVVAISRHDPRKAIDVLLRALAGLRDSGVPFRACLVGTGGLIDYHRRLAGDLGLGEQVLFAGRVPAVMPYLRAADVFVLPSFEEGSGSVSVLEALQSGTATVASAVDGLVEDLTHERDALLAPPGDAPRLQEALGAVLTDAALRERLAAGARATYERRFSPNAYAQALGELYASLGLGPASA